MSPARMQREMTAIMDRLIAQRDMLIQTHNQLLELGLRETAPEGATARAICELEIAIRSLEWRVTNA